ncbi:MAG: hypothetical protein OXH02_06460 [Gemmatimonadetes bacterium]|nr:hypothetical protein [Gemmatimonadota bacterium]
MLLMLPKIPEIKSTMLEISADGKTRSIPKISRLIARRFHLSPNQATNRKFLQRVYNAKHQLKKQRKLVDLHGQVKSRSPNGPGDLRKRPVFRDGKEPFRHNGNSLGFTVYDYWRWMGSDLLNNISRGVLAEFIVAKILGAEEETLNYPRAAWESYDIMYYSKTDDARFSIEVKSSAYYQSWHRNNSKDSVIEFGIAPNARETDIFGETTRSADCYVFCLLGVPDEIPCPLDLEKWEFYILMSTVLNEEIRDQKKIGLSKLRELAKRRGQRTKNYKELSRLVEEAYRNDPPE